MALPSSVVLALPPMSGVRGPSARVASMAPMMELWAEAVSLNYSLLSSVLWCNGLVFLPVEM